LAPGAPRRCPHARAWNVALRTLHLMAFGILVGGHFWGVPAEPLYPALWATVASGAALMGLEIYQNAQWLFLVKGLAVLATRVLLPLGPFFSGVRVPAFFA